MAKRKSRHRRKRTGKLENVDSATDQISELLEMEPEEIEKNIDKLGKRRFGRMA